MHLIFHTKLQNAIINVKFFIPRKVAPLSCYFRFNCGITSEKKKQKQIKQILCNSTVTLLVLKLLGDIVEDKKKSNILKADIWARFGFY